MGLAGAAGTGRRQKKKYRSVTFVTQFVPVRIAGVW
jgi:hypothetical protein